MFDFDLKGDAFTCVRTALPSELSVPTALPARPAGRRKHKLHGLELNGVSWEELSIGVGGGRR